MGETKKQVRNNSVDIFRLVAAILVVAIHTNPLKNVQGIGFVIHEVLVKIAVPFFFTVAGFFYLRSLEKGLRVFKKYLIKTIVVYSLWSIFYFIIKIIQQVISGEFSFIPFLKSSIFSYFLTGSYYHFWFFPALIFSVVIATLFYKMKALKALYVLGLILYLLGCLGCSYYTIALNVPLVSNLIQSSWFEVVRRIFLMGLPFFSLGGILNHFSDKWNTFAKKRQFLVLLLLVIAYVAEIVIVIGTKIYSNTVLTFFLYPLIALIVVILINNPMEKAECAGKISRSCAEFVYYVHPACKLFCQLVFGATCPDWLLFLIVTFMSIAIGICFMKLNVKDRAEKFFKRSK